MKGVMFINPPKEGECDICEAHRQAYHILEDFGGTHTCTKCGEDVHIDPTDTVIYSDNFMLPLAEQEFKRGLLVRCHRCQQNHIVPELIPVIWNANHDVYYLSDEKPVKEASAVLSEAAGENVV